jgi:signal transduction histidine kinase
MPVPDHSSNGHSSRSTNVCKARQDEQTGLQAGERHTRTDLRATSGSGANSTGPGLARALMTVLTAQRSISSQIGIEKLIEEFLVSAVQQAGAERGLLFLVGESGKALKAEAEVVATEGAVLFRSGSMATAAFPQSVLRYVIRMEETVLLDNAFAEHQFSGDEYFGSVRLRSLLCLPLIVRRDHIGVLYLENLGFRAFEPGQLAAVEMLILQSAALLKIELLHADLQEQATERPRANGAVDQIRRKYAQTHLAASLNSNSAPLATLAHELNQPLQVIRSYAQTASRLLNVPAPQLSKVRTAIALINRHISRAADTVSNTMRLFQRDTQEMAAIDILETLNDVHRIVQDDVTFRTVTLRLQLPKSLPAVTGNKSQLSQVFINLLMNGLEAMNDDNQHERELVIEAGQEGSDHIYVAVRDSGKGIDDMDMPRIFDTYYSTKSHGTGMGLAIARAIVENHGGTIWATQNADRGATIMVELPITKHT